MTAENKHKYSSVNGGTCSEDGQFWPCQSILGYAKAISGKLPLMTDTDRLAAALKEAGVKKSWHVAIDLLSRKSFTDYWEAKDG